MLRCSVSNMARWREAWPRNVKKVAAGACDLGGSRLKQDLLRSMHAHVGFWAVSCCLTLMKRATVGIVGKLGACR